jgi:hypothetical protein
LGIAAAFGVVLGRRQGVEASTGAEAMAVMEPRIDRAEPIAARPP